MLLMVRKGIRREGSGTEVMTPKDRVEEVGGSQAFFSPANILSFSEESSLPDQRLLLHRHQ